MKAQHHYRKWGAIIASLIVIAGSSTRAGTQVTSWGTAAPQSSIGGYSLTPFTLDNSSAIGDLTSAFAVPPGASVSGSVATSVPLEHARINDGWNTWSHAYSGDVYWYDEDTFADYNPTGNSYSSSLTLSMPADTKAFYLYLEPNLFGLYEFSITSGAAVQTVQIEGNGQAQGFAFYTDQTTESIDAITISRQGNFSDGFGVGEFGINGTPTVPDGGSTLQLVAAASFALLTLCSRTKK